MALIYWRYTSYCRPVFDCCCCCCWPCNRALIRSAGAASDPPSQSKRKRHSPDFRSPSNANVAMLVSAALCSVQKIAVSSYSTTYAHVNV